MKKSRYSETQIIKVLKELGGGRLLKKVCREDGISDVTYYNWESKYGDMESSDMKYLKEVGRRKPTAESIMKRIPSVFFVWSLHFFRPVLKCSQQYRCLFRRGCG